MMHKINNKSPLTYVKTTKSIESKASLRGIEHHSTRRPRPAQMIRCNQILKSQLIGAKIKDMKVCI